MPTTSKLKPKRERPTVSGKKKHADVARDSKAADSRGKYVYCIVETSDQHRFGAIGIGAEPAEVHTINFKDIAAVVSDTPLEVYDATRENVLAHERVNETVMKEFTVIPMSFGTVFRTQSDVVQFLTHTGEALRDVLSKMKDKIEFGLKVNWDTEAVLKEVETEREDIRRI